VIVREAASVSGGKQGGLWMHSAAKKQVLTLGGKTYSYEVAGTREAKSN
jgi:hypothetical protein